MNEQDLYTQDLKKRHSKITFQKSGQYCWETPEEFFKELDKEFNFNLDACANEENHKCAAYFDEEIDGLKQKWQGNVFMNPPYGTQISKWVKKAYEESRGGLSCLSASGQDRYILVVGLLHERGNKISKREIKIQREKYKRGDGKLSGYFSICRCYFQAT